ncbi:MAG: hypothetical protein AAB573_01395 [Patescibacteria group bacterium]
MGEKMSKHANGDAARAASRERSRRLMGEPEHREKVREGSHIYWQAYWSDSALRADRSAKSSEGSRIAWGNKKRRKERTKKRVAAMRELFRARKSNADKIPSEYQDVYARTVKVMGRREALAQIRVQMEKDRLQKLLP